MLHCFPIWAPLWTRALHPRRAALPLSQAAVQVTSRPCQPNSSSSIRQDLARRERCDDVAYSQHTHTQWCKPLHSPIHLLLYWLLSSVVFSDCYFFLLSASRPPFTLCELNTNCGFVRRQRRSVLNCSIQTYAPDTEWVLSSLFCFVG